MLKNMEQLTDYVAGVREGSVSMMKRPSMMRAIKAKCKDCMCDYVDGRLDCEIPGCSHYYWMPYGQLARLRRELRIKNRVKI